MQTVLAGMETVGIAVDQEALTALQHEFADQIRDAAEAAYAVIGKADQPRLAQAIAGGALRRTGHAEDQEDEDRIHHRRGRTAESFSKRPGTRSSSICWPTAMPPGSRSPSTACSSRPPRTAASTPPSIRPSRPPAGCRPPRRTCRTSRSAPRMAAGSATPSAWGPAASNPASVSNSPS